MFKDLKGIYHADFFTVNSIKDINTHSGTIMKGVWNVGSDTTGVSDKIPVIIIEGINDGPTLWIQGSIHGDEPSSSLTALSLIKEVNPKELNGKIILIPALNIAAFRHRQNITPIDNVQLYKAFLGRAGGSYTYQIANKILQNVLENADYLIDIHAGNSTYFCAEFVSYPVGLEASEKSESMAIASGSPLVVGREIRNEIEKNIMFAHICSRGIPSMMMANGGHRLLNSEIIDPVVKRCINVLKYLKMVPGTIEQNRNSKLLKGIFYLSSNTGGFVINVANIGDLLNEGQVIARIYNIYGEEVEVARSPHKKAYLVETAGGVVNQGEFLAEFFIPRE